MLSWLNSENTKFSSRVTEIPAFSSTAFRPASRTASITFAAKERARLTPHDPRVVTRQVKTEAKHLRLHVKDGHLACQACWED
ncbi:hypothetical protein F7725_019873 [Dissostichus mawsoni]|uniref:Uncharacterized protein n=1 Tax=Dissostichus mawsoni TaxID=36200 RepID=A0A7J5YKZ3_DISMA|nr:hypothetical protein F7725_019873 [Dissostichus mawsoni]